MSISNPHELFPLTLLDDSLPLPDPVRGTKAYSVGVLKIGDLLAEPPARSGEWTPSIIRRLIAASTGPVACGVRRADYRSRLEAAGWFCAAEDADVESARHASWPALPVCRRLGIGAGNPRPALVLVGEAVNHAGQIPFASRAGTWLFLALRLMGYDELTCYVTNALTLRKRRRTKQLAELADAFAPAEATWIALGRCPQEVLKSAKIEHLKVVSPTWHKKFKHSEDVKGYAVRLREAGLECGTWGTITNDPLPQLPIHEVVSLPELPAPYDIRSVAYASGKSTSSSKTQGRHVSAAKREAARRMYVTGEAPSLKEAADAVGANFQHLKHEAKAGNWVAEREDHQRELTERIKQSQLDSTAAWVDKHLSTALRDVWEATALACGRVVKRLRNGKLQPTPQQVESLSRVALTLRAASAGQHDPELDALTQEPLAELARRTLEQLEKGLGGA